MTIPQQLNIPGPKGLPLLGVALDFKQPVMLPNLGKWRQEFGDFFQIPLPAVKMPVVANAEMVKHILDTNQNNYVRTVFYDKIKPIFGEGIITTDGPFWKRQRRLMQSSINQQEIAFATNIVQAATQKLITRWQKDCKEKSPIAVTNELMGLTFEIIAKALFGSDLNEGHLRTMSDAMECAQSFLSARFFTLLNMPTFVPTPKNLRFRQAKRNLDNFIYGLIHEKRGENSAGDQFLGHMMRARDEDSGEAMTDQQLRDEVMTIILAGHETTANALAWTLDLLSKNPGHIEKLAEEADAVLNQGSSGQELVRKLVYAKMVFQESMRLYPPAYFFSRVALADDQLGPYFIKKGTNLYISPWLIHHDSKYWLEPEKFLPERFHPDTYKPVTKYAYFPFGGGPHRCVGEAFAMMEGPLILSMLAQKFRFTRLALAWEVEPEPLITLRPNQNLPLTINLR